jgi:Glycosyl transferase family 2
MSTAVPDPDASVLTRSYGHGRFIGDALREREQAGRGGRGAHRPRAGSQYETIDFLRVYRDRLLLRSEPDRGQADALPKALHLAHGRWIAWVNADEFYIPRALRTLVATGEKSGADVVYGDAAYVDADGRLLRLGPQHGYSRFLLRHCTIFHRSVLGEGPWDVGMSRSGE